MVCDEILRFIDKSDHLDDNLGILLCLLLAVEEGYVELFL